jgi:hypothetical protein
MSIERGLDGFFGNFRIGDALGVLELKGILQMPGDCLTFTVRVCGQIDGFRIFDEPGQAGQHILASICGDILRFEIRSCHTHFLDR